MKKILVIASFLISASAFAQFPSTDSLRAYDNKFITNSAVNAFTNLRLNTLLYGIINWIDSAKLGTTGSVGLDTLYNFNDSTLKYKKNGVFYTFSFKGVYDSRKKVDTAYSKNDSTLAILINGIERTILIRGNSKGTPSNVGSFFRLLVNGTNNFKTLAKGHGVLIDSTSNANALTFIADTATLYPEVRATITGGGGTPGGSNTQVQINNSGSFGAVSGFTASTSTHEVAADSLTSHRIILDSNLYRTLSASNPIDSIDAFGNSITNATGATAQDSGYIYLFKSFLGKPLNNHAVSGTGINTSIANHNIYINPGHTAMTVLMAGFNDARRAAGRPTTNKILAGTRAVFVNHNLASYVSVSGGSVTRYGTWATGWPATSEGGKTNTGAYTTNSGDSMTYVFTGPNVCGVVLGIISGGYVAIYVDNVRVDSFSLNAQTDGVTDASAYTNNRIPLGFYYNGFSAGSHTFKIINRSATLMIVDYLGTLVDPAIAKPMLIMEAPHMDATGYATTPANATGPIIDTINAKLDSLQAAFVAFGYPVFIAHTNNSYSATTSTGLSSDHIHPNNTGHRQIFNEAVSGFTNLPVTSREGMEVYSNNKYLYRNGAWEQELTVPQGNGIYVQNQSASNQVANFNITGTGTAAKYNTAASSIGANILQTDGAFTAGTVTGTPFFGSYNASGTTDNKLFDFVNGGTSFSFRALNDANTIAGTWLKLNRSGTTLGTLDIGTQANFTLSSGVNMVMKPFANLAVIDFSGTSSITGTSRPIFMSQNVSQGIQLYLKNTGTAGTAYTNVMLESAGGTAGPAFITFRNTTLAKDYNLGHDTLGNFKLAYGNAQLLNGTTLMQVTSVGAFNLPYYGSNSTAVDTTTYKPAVIDASGNVKKFSSWAGFGGGVGIPDTLSNVGGLSDSAFYNPSTHKFSFRSHKVNGDGNNIIVDQVDAATNTVYTVRAPNLYDTTYTPSYTNTTNVSSSTPESIHAMRVGNSVTVYGRVTLTPTITLTNTVLTISLPFATVMGGPSDVGGTGAANGVVVFAGTTTSASTCFLQWTASGTSSQTMSFSFTYHVTPP